VVLWLKGNSISMLLSSYTAGNKREITPKLFVSFECDISYEIMSTVIVINVQPG